MPISTGQVGAAVRGIISRNQETYDKYRAQEPLRESAKVPASWSRPRSSTSGQAPVSPGNPGIGEAAESAAALPSRLPRISVAPMTPFQLSFAASAKLRSPGAVSVQESQLAVSGHSAKARRARGHGPGTVPGSVQQSQLIASGHDAQARRRRAR
ncbi:hypothetical protein OG215_38315 (plasmid) [Streptomyces globisporus]|uniref:hypothetical protein n=1 Tax=Streptomyces globisporus TaxID=1908 RepID=UPI002F90E3AD|nr:hypothetical protein OG215_38315 [Streptomyces globisporus]